MYVVKSVNVLAKQRHDRSRWFLDTARDAGYKGIIAGTRKTTPGE